MPNTFHWIVAGHLHQNEIRRKIVQKNINPCVESNLMKSDKSTWHSDFKNKMDTLDRSHYELASSVAWNPVSQRLWSLSNVADGHLYLSCYIEKLQRGETVHFFSYFYVLKNNTSYRIKQKIMCSVRAGLN